MSTEQDIRAVLDAEADAIRRVAVTDAFVVAVNYLAQARGKVITTGMGKAGLMAQKCAATFCALATPAVYLHPGEAAHGDFGVIAPDDVLIAFSTSGRTTEVLELIASARRFGVGVTIAISAHPENFESETLVIDMGAVTEPCHLGLTPSASSAVMLAIGDALALSVAKAKGISRQDFALRHRAGYLGHLAVSA